MSKFANRWDPDDEIFQDLPDKYPKNLIRDIRNFFGAGEVWIDESGEIHFTSDEEV